jgi:hypothetical protein
VNEEHVSDLRWDRLLAGELDDVARTHAASCARCEARFRELTAERAAFALRPVGFPLAKPVRRHARWWLGGSIAALAAAAIVIVVIRRIPPEPGERTKGHGPSLILAAGRPGALVLLAAGDTIRPGDYVQAGYTATRDGFGAVLARDGAGATVSYVPSRGDTMVALPAGTERSFPESTVLDAVVGREQLVVLWCEHAHPIAPLLEQLRARQDITAPDGCVSRSLMLEKAAP